MIQPTMANMHLPLILVLCSICWFSLPAAEVTDAARQKALNQRIAVLVTALTDSRERVHERAVAALAEIGKAALPDLEILARDENPALRLRVALVLTQIDGAASRELLLQMSYDAESAVREVVTLGLGRKRHDDVLRRLAVLLNDEVPGVRESAALAVALTDDGRGIRLLANAFVMERIPENITPQLEQQLKRARTAKYDALRALCQRPHHMSFVQRYVDKLQGPMLHVLLEVTWSLADPRLCPTLISVLKKDIDLESQRRAAKSLRSNGDARCVEVLCRIAADNLGPAFEAAKALSVLTGHQSGPGKGWALWWRDHEQRIEEMIPRDAFIARLHDLDYQPTAADMQRFQPRQLEMVIDGILGDGARHWPEQAWLALQQDDPARWSAFLLQEYAEEPSEVRRVGLLLIMLRLGDPVVKPVLQKRYKRMNDQMHEQKQAGNVFAASNSERLVLELFSD